MSGRIVDIAVAESPGTRGGRLGTVIYIAAATGGVWKSTSGGIDWDPIFDDAGVGSMGDVTVAPSASDIVWVAAVGIYGGLQDNATWGGPSRTRNSMGIGNADWIRDGRGRRVLRGHRPHRTQHRLRGIAERQHPALQPAHRRTKIDPGVR